jgi:hypothetical protein
VPDDEQFAEQSDDIGCNNNLVHKNSIDRHGISFGTIYIEFEVKVLLRFGKESFLSPEACQHQQPRGKLVVLGGLSAADR